MKIAILFVLHALMCLGFARAQQSKTFAIEKLETKDGILRVEPYEQILKKLLLLEYGDHGLVLKDNSDFPFNIIAKNKISDSLVDFGHHPFFNGMYEAYANHHAFTLSPDMIWLLIAQGFARHVNAHAEELRSMFVDFKKKLALVVQNDSIQLDDPNSPWQEVFPEFTKKIGEYTGQQLINTLTPDFTATTPVDKIAADITIMTAMKEYFEFIEMTNICGIPKITIEGTEAELSTPVLISTWADASWAIDFYKKHGFRLLQREEKRAAAQVLDDTRQAGGNIGGIGKPKLAKQRIN